MRSFRDRDFVQTVEDMFFCVVGNIHPPDRVIAYLKYIPSRLGRWGRRSRYSRVLKSYTTPSVKEVLRLLKENFPQYVSKLDYMGIEMITVPLNRVKLHLKPEIRLSQLMSKDNGNLDPLERKTIRLANLLSEASGVKIDHLGVTGSILLNIHNPAFSDVDLVVYSKASSLKIKEAVKRLMKEKVLQRLDAREFKRWAYSKAKQYNLDIKDAEEICSRTWNRGFYGSTPFSIHPVKVEEEISISYGDVVYIPRELARIRAVVIDADDSCFLPATYRISDVEFLEGKPVDGLTEIVTYEGFYSGIIENGEPVEARGKVEKVLDKRTMKTHYRLLVGSFEAKGLDYIKPLIRRFS